MSALLDWLWNQVWPNIFASIVIAVVLWFWKLRKHFHLTREIHSKLHQEDSKEG